MRLLNKIKQFFSNINQGSILHEQQMLALGKLLSYNITARTNQKSFEEIEFKIFSQWGDDGIIQWLIKEIELPYKYFIEFGVEEYREANTRFLMMNNNWSGLVLDGCAKNISRIIHSEYFWKYDLQARTEFITAENINKLLADTPKEPGILSIDIDGNDYWIWNAMERLRPIIVITEYNSLFGKDRAITIPYDPHFNRTKAHHSNLFFGASIKALVHLAKKKGYAFIGSNSAGNNAYFVRKDKLNSRVKQITAEEGFVHAKFRESRDKNARLSFIPQADQIALIKDMAVFNVVTNKAEPLF